MITFSVALLALVLGYLFYGGLVSRIFGVNDNHPTPVQQHQDGIDYVAMPTWKVFMIQYLNIAGLGPIFGAIMGAKYGTSSYLWIVLGTIFAGSVHDFFSGMLSVRNNGESLPMLVGRYLGAPVKHVMMVITLLLLIVITAVFVSQPADILSSLCHGKVSVYVWIGVIFAYYFVAAMFPIDKIIGRIYPLFAVALIFMAVGLLVMLYVKQPDIPEIWEGLGTNYIGNPIFPMMCITIACGAISGFHATQSPMMARCLQTERHGKAIFYGAMVLEGLTALVWAAVATSYYGTHGASETAGPIAMAISKDWLGTFGGLLAILGVICAPISTGDTAFRSARLIIADEFHIDQTRFWKRMSIGVPLFLVTLGVLICSLVAANGFNVIWLYNGLLNQTLATVTLWTITVYLLQEKKCHWVAMVPAMFMTFVVCSFILIAPTATYDPDRGIGMETAYLIAAVVTLGITSIVLWGNKKRKTSLQG